MIIRKRKIVILGLAMLMLILPASAMAGLGFDHGDLPASYGDASAPVEDGVMLGTCIDADPGAQDSVDAMGDDNDGGLCGNDDDGVTFSRPDWMTPGATVTVTVFGDVGTHNDDYLSAWIDFDGSGTMDASEKIIDDAEYTSTGSKEFTFTVPGDADPQSEWCYARFRFDSDQDLGPTGESDRPGEIEDYAYQCRESMAVTMAGNSIDANSSNVAIVAAFGALLAVATGFAAIRRES